MSDLFGNHIVGFPTRRLNLCQLAVVTIEKFIRKCFRFAVCLLKILFVGTL